LSRSARTSRPYACDAREDGEARFRWPEAWPARTGATGAPGSARPPPRTRPGLRHRLRRRRKCAAIVNGAGGDLNHKFTHQSGVNRLQSAEPGALVFHGKLRGRLDGDWEEAVMISQSNWVQVSGSGRQPQSASSDIARRPRRLRRAACRRCSRPAPDRQFQRLIDSEQNFVRRPELDDRVLEKGVFGFVCASVAIAVPSVRLSLMGSGLAWLRERTWPSDLRCQPQVQERLPGRSRILNPGGTGAAEAPLFLLERCKETLVPLDQHFGSARSSPKPEGHAPKDRSKKDKRLTAGGGCGTVWFLGERGKPVSE